MNKTTLIILGILIFMNPNYAQKRDLAVVSWKDSTSINRDNALRINHMEAVGENLHTSSPDINWSDTIKKIRQDRLSNDSKVNKNQVDSVRTSLPDSINNDTHNDSVNLELPPLQILLNNARRSSIVEYYDAKLIEEMASLDIEKRSWLKYLKLEGSYRYGTSGIAGEGSDPIFKFSSSLQNIYSVGVSLSIPLDDLFSRGLKNKKQSMRVRETEIELNKSYDELKITIIEAYTMASKMLLVIDLRNEIVTSTTLEYKDAEKDYRRGRCTLDMLNEKKMKQVSAIQEYEDLRLTLNNILLKLEILSRTQIISK